MARPLPTGKQSVNLAPPEVRVSKIRRDPPPVQKELTIVDVEEREAWTVVVGIAIFALSLFVIAIGFSAFAGWSPRQYTIDVRESH